VGGICFGIECNLLDVWVALTDGGTLDQLRRSPENNEAEGREIINVRLFILTLILLEVVVQLLGGGE